jgi:DNA polymerase III subunit chi
MTEVAFHFNVPQLLPYACRLLRKATQAKAQVTVVASESELQGLDTQLWSFDPGLFLPHCLWGAPEHVRTRSPIVLTPATALSASPHRDVMLHWGTEMPPAGFESFARLIELVSTEEDDRACARVRWKHYADRGYPITRYDVGSVKN